jgi:hypothetical protein
VQKVEEVAVTVGEEYDRIARLNGGFSQERDSTLLKPPSSRFEIGDRQSQ